jgi:hypothetical protein
VAGGPRLEWGRLAAFDLISASRVPGDLVRSWQVAQHSLGLVVRPIERFELAGTLNGHPGHVRSDQAKEPFGAIFALAVASRTAAEPLRSQSLRTSAAALLAWAGVYRRTYDFVQRDALHYHLAALQPLVELMLCTPDLVSAAVRSAVLSGIDFLRPYFLRQAEHIEFAATTISFDLARRDDGNPVFQQLPRDPAHARVLLRLARPVFPEIQSWTDDIVDARYDPRTKLLAAIHGEPQRRADWP